jgi:hypothetical protein
VKRAWLAMTVLATGCSLNSAGTAESVDFVDASGGTDVTVSTDTGVTPVDTLVLDDTASEDAFVADTEPADIAPDVPVCPPAKGGAKPCDEIEHREELATGQTMDGAPDDFCDVKYVDFDNSKGAIRAPSPTPSDAITTMRIRVAWSSFGIHAHLAVKDPLLLPRKPTSDTSVFLGDSVEIYIAGHTGLTGAFDNMSRDLGAQQIIFTAPDATTPSRAMYFYMGAATGSPPSFLWTARITSTGYDVELRIPWADLKPPSTPASGKRIALSWAFNNKYDSTEPQAFSVFQLKPPPSSSSCSGDAQPFCDDRLWCTPQLL